MRSRYTINHHRTLYIHKQIWGDLYPFEKKYSMMKTGYFTVALVLLLCAQAFAETEFSIDCGSIHSMYIHSGEDIWSLSIQLTPEASQDFYHFTQQHQKEVVAVTYPGGVFTRACVQGAIVSGGMSKTLPTEQAARDLADAICPSKLREPDADWADKESAKDHPALATSPTVPISCADVAEMKLYKGRFDFFKDKTGDDFVYLLHVGLTNETAQRIEESLRTMEPLFFEINGGVHSERHVEISVRGGRIRSDAPLLDRYNDEGATLTFATPEAAGDAAAVICPEKIPTSIVYPGGQ